MVTQVVTAIVSMVLGAFVACLALADSENVVIVRTVAGVKVVEYKDRDYKLVAVEIKKTVEVVE